MGEPLMIPMFSPDGSSGKVPRERVDEAVQKGFKLGVSMRAPSGELGIVPRDRLVQALGKGFKVERNDPTGTPEQASVWDAQGMGGPAGEISKRAGSSIFEGLKEQFTPTVESLAGPVGTPMRAVVDSIQFARRGIKEGPRAAAEELAGSVIPLPVAKIASQVGAGKYSEALGTTALAGAELAGLMGLGKAATKSQGAKVEPVIAEEVMGRAIQDYVKKADSAIHQEVGKHAENFINAVDDPVRNPLPAIDAKSKMVALQDGFNEYSHTLTRIGLKIPPGLEKLVTEALQSPRWTAAQAKDVRSALYEMKAKSGDARVRGALGLVIQDLTSDLRGAAKKAGVESDFDSYSTMHRQQMKLREQFIDPVRDAETGKQAMSKLLSEEGAVKITLPALKSYGIDPKVITDAMDFSKGVRSPKTLWGHWAARHAGGHAAAALGLPWISGYFGAGMAETAMQRHRTIPTVKAGHAYQKGLDLVERALPAPPSSVAVPTEVTPQQFTPAALEASGAKRALAVPQKAPSAPTAQPKVATEVAPELPKPPHPLNVALSRIGQLKKFRSKLVSPKSPLTEQELAFVEKHGGIEKTLKVVRTMIEKESK